MIIGKNGEMLKRSDRWPGPTSRILWVVRFSCRPAVKVKENWRDNQTAIKNFGYSTNKTRNYR